MSSPLQLPVGYEGLELRVEEPDSLAPVVPEAIRRYLAGQPLASLSSDLGLSFTTVYTWLFSALGEEQYYKLRAAVHARLIAEADAALLSAEEKFELDKAVHRCRFARYDFERKMPTYYSSNSPGIERDQAITVIVQSVGSGTQGQRRPGGGSTAGGGGKKGTRR